MTNSFNQRSSSNGKSRQEERQEQRHKEIMENLYYMAAFAAFLMNRRTRICAALCLLYMLIEWNLYALPNDEPDYLFQYYYIILGAYCLCACYFLKYLPNSDQSNLFMALFLLMANQDLWGFLLYTYDQDPQPHNFAGNCIIMTLIFSLWTTRNGKLEGIINLPDFLTRVRSYLQGIKGKTA